MSVKESGRQTILNVATDIAGEFLYYGRKEDEDLPRGEIEKAIAAGENTLDEIVSAFREGCAEHLQ